MSEQIQPSIDNITIIKDIVAWIGTALAIGLKITPSVLFYKIFMKIEKHNIIPESMLVFNVLVGQLWMCYWLRQDNFVPTFSAGVGTCFSILFAALYLFIIFNGKWTTFIIALLIVGDLILQVFYGLLYILPLPIVGKFAMIINIISYAAPGQNIIKVIRKGDYKLIPIVTTMAGLLCSMSWTLFGILQKDWNAIIPNSLGIFFSSVNILVWFIFYCKSKGNNSNEKSKALVEEGVEMKPAKD